jgi:hypothetical protein
MPAIPPPTTTMFSGLFPEAMIAVLMRRDMIEVVLYEISTKRECISLEILIHRVEGMRADVNEHRLYPNLSNGWRVWLRASSCKSRFIPSRFATSSTGSSARQLYRGTQATE